jgi:DHA2 family multidrug resistance protein
MVEFMPITHDWGARQLLLPQAFRGIGQQLAIPPTVILTLGGLAPAKLRQASGLFNLMRNLGGAMGIAGCATILTNRTNLHFYRLSEHLNATNEPMNALLASNGYGSADPQAQTSALQSLWMLTFREAQTLTYSDAFLAILVCFAFATVMVPLMRKVVPPKGPSPDAH